jgi:hypothetical protein
MNYFKEYCADYITINKKNVDLNMLKKLKYPIIFKPNYCSEYSHQVEIIKNYKKSIAYLKKSVDNSIIIQHYHPGPHEGTIFYTKDPLTNKTNIIVVERVPNGKVGQFWLWKSSISFKHGYYAVHRSDLETKELKKIIDKISSKIPDFYFGRYDIRFTDYEKLKKGTGFKIIELGGYDSADTRWDSNNSKKYNLNIIKNWFIIRYKYGLINIFKGRYCSATDFIIIFLKTISKIHICKQEDKIHNVFKKLFRAFG